MAESSGKLEGPDFAKGCKIDELGEGKMLLGHAFGEPILVARRGPQLFAIGATCTHYGGPLAKGLMVDCIVRCPWHHARFDVRTGEAIAAPALSDVSCWKIDQRDNRFFVTGKLDKKSARKPKSSPASVVIVGAGAAGNAAAEMLRRQGYDGPVILIGADESLPYDRPNLSKDPVAIGGFLSRSKGGRAHKDVCYGDRPKSKTGDAVRWPLVKLWGAAAGDRRRACAASNSGRRSAARLLFANTK